MSRTIRSSLVLLVAGSAALLCGAAGPAPSSPPPRAAKPEASVPRERPLRDPTVPGPTLRTLVSKPVGGPVAVPVVELKGRILASPRPPMVTLAVGNQLHMVPEGSRIALPGAGEIRVSKITAEEVQLQILPLDYTLTLH